jgi:hypothetical protein
VKREKSVGVGVCGRLFVLFAFALVGLGCWSVESCSVLMFFISFFFGISLSAQYFLWFLGCWWFSGRQVIIGQGFW